MKENNSIVYSLLQVCVYIWKNIIFNLLSPVIEYFNLFYKLTILIEQYYLNISKKYKENKKNKSTKNYIFHGGFNEKNSINYWSF